MLLNPAGFEPRIPPVCNSGPVCRLVAFPHITCALPRVEPATAGMDDSGSARRAAFLSDRWWRHNPIVAAVLTVAVAAAVLPRTRTGGAPQAQCRAGACSALQAQVEAHVARVHGELQEMVTSLCPTDLTLDVPSPWGQQQPQHALG